MKRLFSRACLLLTCLALSACATRYINPTTTRNPPPTVAFSQFDRFEVKPIQLAPQYAQDAANQKALAKIQEHFDNQIGAVVKGWATKSDKKEGRTLLIEPRVEHLKFIGGGARFWAGPLAGSSAVIMKVKYTDLASGKVIADPEFFQRAAAMSGAWTMGGQDNAMLERIVSIASAYNNNNYSQLVGGPSGATEEMVKAKSN